MRGLPKDRDITYYGNDGVFIHDPGVLKTDYTGLSTCSCVFMAPRDKWKRFDNIYDAHPEFKFIGMNSREVAFEGPFAVATCEYGGFDPSTYGDFTPPVYELTRSSQEEPIETHKLFSESIAGTPTNRLHNSLWRRLEDNMLSNKFPPTEDAGWVFHGFEINTGFYGLERYLDIRAVWKETVNWRRGFGTRDPGGRIETPRGSAPNLGGFRTWLNAGTTVTINGASEQTVTEWWGSGPGGWIPLIYST